MSQPIEEPPISPDVPDVPAESETAPIEEDRFDGVDDPENDDFA